MRRILVLAFLGLLVFQGAYSLDIFEDDIEDHQAQTCFNGSIITREPLKQVLAENPQIKCLQVSPEYPFHFIPFPVTNHSKEQVIFSLEDPIFEEKALSKVGEIAKQQPAEGNFLPTFILTIPNGCVYSEAGWVFVNDKMIEELTWKSNELGLKGLSKARGDAITYIPGRVAVITQRGEGCYFHWISEVLSRLAMLEMSGVEYDYLYVSTRKPFMRESLALWGVDSRKIITPEQAECIQAEELIVPSLVSKIDKGYTRYASYAPDYLLTYVKHKLLNNLDQLNIENPFYQERIFISRKDSQVRRATNEDSVIEILQAKGFKSYELTKLSFIQQLQLFSSAEMIIGAHGAGLVNTLFCQEGTKVIELFQARGSATYWFMSQMFGLNHFCVKTTNLTTNSNGFIDTEIPLNIIQDIADRL